MVSHARDDSHNHGPALMQIAFFAVAGYVALTGACFAALMSLAKRIRRRDEREARTVAAPRRRLHV
jgi:hypothetical protein